jgi:hypothetical protein
VEVPEYTTTFIVVFGRLLGLSWDENDGEKVGAWGRSENLENRRADKFQGPSEPDFPRTNRISFETPTDASNFLCLWIIRSRTNYLGTVYVVTIVCAIRIPSFKTGALSAVQKRECPKLLNPAIHTKIWKEVHQGCCYCLFQPIAINHIVIDNCTPCTEERR